MNNEQDLLASEQEEQQNPDVAEETSGEATQSEEVPEKFKGKSAAEIARSALEAEKAMHESKSEMSSIRRQLQETQQYIQMLQSQRSQPQQQEIDPLAIVEKEWDEDPKQALVKGLRTVQNQAEAQREKLLMETRTKEGTDYYYSRKQADQDFAQRETDMVELSKRYGHLVRPDFATSKEAYEFLHLAARGARVSDYEKSAVEKANKQKELIKDEKRRAVSERSGVSSSSSEDALVDLDTFSRMTPAQQQAELDKSARRIGRTS